MEKAKVLIVDSNEISQQLLAEYFKSEKDVDVIIKTKLEDIENIPSDVDIIIAGNRFPLGSGAKALVDSETKATKCLYTTAYSEDLSANIEEEGINFFQKPNIKALMNFVKEKLGKIC